MNRKELTDEEKITLLERIISRIFGHWGQVKVDWKQEGYMGPQVVLKNVGLEDREKIELLTSLSGQFDLEIDSRVIVGDENDMIPMSGGKDLADSYYHLNTELDLTISPKYDQYLLNKDSKELGEIRENMSAKWTEKDEEENNHRYFSKKEGGALHPNLFRFKNTPEELKKRLKDLENTRNYLKKELKKQQTK